MRKLMLIGAALTGLLAAGTLAACAPEPAKTAEAPPPPPPPKPPTEAEAIALVDKVPAALIAGDINGGIAVYTDDAVMFDPMSNEMILTKAANLESTKGFMSAGVTKLVNNVQKVQILDADNFIVTSLVSAEMTDPKTKKKVTQTMRLTDTAHKQADGTWKIVNEHLSAAPVPVKAALPVVKEFLPPAAAPAPAPAAAPAGTAPASPKPAGAAPATPASPKAAETKKP